MKSGVYWRIKSVDGLTPNEAEIQQAGNRQVTHLMKNWQGTAGICRDGSNRWDWEAGG